MEYKNREPMESANATTKRYQNLMKDVETKDYYKIDLSNRVNCYVCKCGHITKTKDVDAGVTPMFNSCEECGQMAPSSFYEDIAPDQKPTFEWYRPSLKEVLKMRQRPQEIEHVFNGGLLIRPIVINQLKQTNFKGLLPSNS